MTETTVSEVRYYNTVQMVMMLWLAGLVVLSNLLTIFAVDLMLDGYSAVFAYFSFSLGFVMLMMFMFAILKRGWNYRLLSMIAGPPFTVDDVDQEEIAGEPNTVVYND